MLKSYKELIVWQKAMQLVNSIYGATDKLPKQEHYVLTTQMRRSVISIPSNIAEGYKRKGTGEYIQFLSIADASNAELETQLLIAKSQYPNIDFSEAESLLEEISKMLIAIKKALRSKPKSLNPKP